jgi:hypothetical protein
LEVSYDCLGGGPEAEAKYLKRGAYRHGYIKIAEAEIERMLKANLTAIKV